MTVLELDDDRVEPESTDGEDVAVRPRPRRAWLVVGLALAGGALASLGTTLPVLRVGGVALAVMAAAVAPTVRLAALAGFLATALAATGSDPSPDGDIGRYVLVVVAGIVGAVVAAQARRPAPVRHLAHVGLALAVLVAGALPGPTAPTSGPSEAELAGASLDRATADRLDQWLREQVRARRIPGAGVSVTTTDDVLFERAYGVAGADRRPMEISTPILLASVSKSFTGLAMAVLAEQGRLDLDAPVQQYLPDFTLAPGHEDHAAAITVADVPNQVTGLPRVEGINAVGRDNGLAAAVAHLATVSPVQPPGARFEYSNLNFQLAGRIVEVASGRDFGSFLRDEVLDPLGLENTTAEVDPVVDGLERSDGYTTLFGLMPRRHDRALAASGVPAGGVSASIGDLTRYLRVQLGRGEVDGRQLLAPAVFDLLHRATPGADVQDGRTYNMGWVLVDDAGERRIEHGGAWTNTSTTLVFHPERDLGVAVAVPHMALASPAASSLRAGVEAVLDGREPPTVAGYAWDYAVVDVVLAALVALVVLAVSGVPGWRDRSRRPLWLRTTWVVLSHLLLPLVALVGWPASYGVPWTLQARFLPDLVPLIVVCYLVLLVAGASKLVQAARPHGGATTIKETTP